MGGTDGLCVHQVLERIQIGAHEVDFLEGSASVPWVDGKLRFHAVGEFLGAGAAVCHAQLHAQVLCGVVAASQHDAADGVLVVRHRPAQGRRGTVVLRQLDAEAMGRGHLGGQLGVGMRILPAVVSDDQGSGRVGGAPGRRGLFLEHARGRVDYAHDVVVREAFADDGTPSVGAEMYVFHKVPFHALGSTRTPPAPSQATCRSAALAALRHARARLCALHLCASLARILHPMQTACYDYSQKSARGDFFTMTFSRRARRRRKQAPRAKSRARQERRCGWHS